MYYYMWYLPTPSTQQLKFLTTSRVMIKSVWYAHTCLMNIDSIYLKGSYELLFNSQWHSFVKCLLSSFRCRERYYTENITTIQANKSVVQYSYDIRKIGMHWNNVKTWQISETILYFTKSILLIITPRAMSLNWSELGLIVDVSSKKEWLYYCNIDDNFQKPQYCLLFSLSNFQDYTVIWDNNIMCVGTRVYFLLADDQLYEGTLTDHPIFWLLQYFSALLSSRRRQGRLAFLLFEATLQSRQSKLKIIIFIFLFLFFFRIAYCKMYPRQNSLPARCCWHVWGGGCVLGSSVTFWWARS